MSLASIISLVPLIGVGIVSCYTDFKYGRIPNWLIVIGLSSAILIFMFLFGYNVFFLDQPGNIAYLFKSFSNIGIGAIVSIFLWRAGFWSAGDAKLFIVYLALVPLEAYSIGHIPSFPGFNLLVNLFFPLVIALFMSAIVYSIRKLLDKEFIRSIKEKITLKAAIELAPKAGKLIVTRFLDFFFMFLMFWGFSAIISLLFGTDFRLDPFAMYFILIFTMGKFLAAKKKIKAIGIATYAVSIGYMSYLVLLGNWSQISRMIFFAIVFMFSIGVTRKILLLYIQKAEIKEVKVKDMFRGAMIHKEDMSAVDNMLVDTDRKEEFGWLQPGGLTEAQAKIIKEIFVGREDTIVRTYRSFPFAPFLSLSAILTFATGTSFLAILRKLVMSE